MPDERTSYRVCSLCEATCGLEIRTRGREVVSIRGDEADVFSRGFICPKAYALKELDADPDRLQTPLVRRNGALEPATWDEAFAEIERRLVPILRERGRDAVAVYLGNPSAHSLALGLYGQVFLRLLGTKNLYSASTVDQMPKQVAVGLMFGTMLSTPVPDLDRTDYLLVLGANPFVSNGSLMTAPDVPGRLRAIRRRGGTVVVIDPRRTRTAAEASEHHFIRPGTDAYLLFGIVHTLFAEGLVRLGPLAPHTAGVEQVEALARPFTPEAVAARCGIAADVIRRLPRRGDRDAGRGAGPRAGHDRRQPGAQHAERRAPRARARGARLHGEPRHLPERDDAPRRRDPARPLAARAVALRPGAPPARHPQRGHLLAARVRSARGSAPRVGDAAPSRRPRGRPGAGGGHGGGPPPWHTPAPP